MTLQALWGYRMFDESEWEEKKGYLFLTVGDGQGNGDPEDDGQNT